MKLTLLSLLIASFSYAQEFPKDWIGNYQGNMILGNANRANDTVPVDFEIKTEIQDSIWTYKMTYHSDLYGEMVKNYRIVATQIGDQKNFLFDEKNGIKMEMTHMNGTFYGMYDVMGSTFISSMRFINEQLLIELISASRKKKFTTQTEATEGEKTIVADSYKPMLHQTVWLTRQ